MKERVGVFGAGAAGLAAAYTLGKYGFPVDVFEAEATVGGMARTLEACPRIRICRAQRACGPRSR